MNVMSNYISEGWFIIYSVKVKPNQASIAKKRKQFHSFLFFTELFNDLWFWVVMPCATIRSTLTFVHVLNTRYGYLHAGAYVKRFGWFLLSAQVDGWELWNTDRMLQMPECPQKRPTLCSFWNLVICLFLSWTCPQLCCVRLCVYILVQIKCPHRNIWPCRDICLAPIRKTICLFITFFNRICLFS